MLKWYIAVIKKYAVLNGRASRKEYWFFLLVNTTISAILAYIDIHAGTFTVESGVGFFGGIYVLLVISPAISVTVRRLHDTNRTGWWFLIVLIPFIGVVFLLFLMALKGSSGTNKYGPSPT